MDKARISGQKMSMCFINALMDDFFIITKIIKILIPIVDNIYLFLVFPIIFCNAYILGILSRVQFENTDTKPYRRSSVSILDI